MEEHTASRGPQSTSGELLSCLTESGELSCISLTLVEKISSSLTSQRLPPQLTLYCVEVLRVLVEDMDLLPQLIHQFQAEDQMISHLAAKSVSACVVYHLHTSGMVSPVWQDKCAQAFLSSPPGPDVDACLWSLTDVLKKLLKGAHREILGKLLAAFDGSVSALCSRLLPETRKAVTQCLVDCSSTFCLLLDLLEVLAASSLICGAAVCLRSQRLIHIHCSALLTTISCSSEYFVKKRAVLLLKRAVLQKVGEDLALGEVLSTGLKYDNLSSDMRILAQSVLTAVAGNWLQSIQVESAAFFGGTRHIRGGEGQKPDCVMLRAVSLLLLKSIELHIQTVGGTAGGDNATEVYEYLQTLWCFLRQFSGQLEVTHLCCWISLLFGEQDDDTMEAARALFSIFLHLRLCSGLDNLAVLEAACASGCNPHCHFVFLLQSVSFDHSILLDFLISTETCFLEYFVRYLKYLRDDWQGFTAACGGISQSDCYFSLQQSLTASCGGDRSALTYKGEPKKIEFSSCVRPTDGNPPVERMTLAAGFHLVEYDSSDESDPENIEACDVKPGAYVCEKSRFSALDVKQKTSGLPVSIGQKQCEPLTLLSEPNSCLERRPEGSSLPVLQSEQTSCTDTLSGQVTCETTARAVRCLSGLREVVTRLQTKKLFPYNPSSLLKLLAQVENCYQQSQQSHFRR